VDINQELSVVLSGKMSWDQLSSQSGLFTMLFTLVTSRDTRRWMDTCCYVVLLLPVHVLARSTQNLATKNCCTSNLHWHSYEFIMQKNIGMFHAKRKCKKFRDIVPNYVFKECHGYTGFNAGAHNYIFQ
jgi:hypothetical protein